MKTSSAVVAKMEARELAIHPFAQRQLLPSKLKRLKDEMDLDAVGIIHAVRYAIDGKMGTWVIDGQHRVRALMDLGLGEWSVEVKLHLDVLDNERASALFLKLNDRASVSPFDKYENELRSGVEATLAATKILHSHGIKMARHGGDSAVGSPSTVKTIYAMDSGRSLDDALSVICEAWGHREAAMEGKLIEGVAIVMHKYNGSIDRPALIKKLAKYQGGPSAVIGDARTYTKIVKITLSRSVAVQVINAYNAGRRSGVIDPL